MGGEQEMLCRLPFYKGTSYFKAEATHYIRIYINLDYSLSLRYSAWCVRRAWYIWKLDKSIRHNFSCSQNAFFIYHSVVRLALEPWTKMFHQPTIRNYFTDFADSQPRYVLSMFLNFWLILARSCVRTYYQNFANIVTITLSWQDS